MNDDAHKEISKLRDQLVSTESTIRTLNGEITNKYFKIQFKFSLSRQLQLEENQLKITSLENELEALKSISSDSQQIRNYHFQIEQLKAELYAKSSRVEQLSVSDIFSTKPIMASTPYKTPATPTSAFSNQLERTRQKVEKVHNKMSKVMTLRSSNQKMNSVLLNMAQEECRELTRLLQHKYDE